MNHLQSLPEGTELVGDFRVERVLGAGGFGITYLAEEPALARKVTIKEYFPNDFAARDKNQGAVPRSKGALEDYDWGLERFLEEAQILARFDHRHIVRVHRYFRANNTGYIVLNFEEGQSLKSWLNRLKRAPRQNELDRIIEPLLDALAEIHAADFLHRDIAPDNIIIREDNSPVLIDFGSARGELAQHTRTVSALVKPGYSPYEQYSDTSKQQGPWTDIYALAATLYHAITGKRPPDSPTRILKDELAPARETALSAYRLGFLKAIDHGLALEIDKRPKSIAAWRGELLAPDPEPRLWFARGRTGDAGDDDSPASEDDGNIRETANTATAEAAPPPDAPGQKGGFVDFIERLKGPPAPDAGSAQNNGSAMQEKAPPAATANATDSDAKKNKAEKIDAASSAADPPVRGFARLFSDGTGTKKAKTKPAKPAKPPKPKPRTPDRAPMPAKQARAKPAQALVVRKAESRRTARSARRSLLRPLAFKLLVGLGVASVAVAYQDRIPRMKFLGLSFVAPKTHEATASRSESQPPRPQQSAVHSLLVRRFKAHIPGDSLVRYAHNGDWVVTTGADSTLKLWPAAGGAAIRTIDMEEGPATALAVSGDRALTGHSEGTIALWELEKGRKIASFKRSGVRIWSVAFETGTNRVISAGHDWTVAIWRINAPETPLHVFHGHESAVQAVALAPVGNEIATGGADRLIQLWNTTSLSKVRTYPREADFITALRFSPDARVLAAGLLNGRVRLLSSDRRRRLLLLSGHDDAITSLRFLGDGDHLISTSKDGTSRLWDLSRGLAIRTYGSYGPALLDGDLTPGGNQLVTSNADGVITVWKVGAIPANDGRD
jgi:WD40 repeat protein/serine/threonine protein kinase